MSARLRKLEALKVHRHYGRHFRQLTGYNLIKLENFIRENDHLGPAEFVVASRPFVGKLRESKASIHCWNEIDELIHLTSGEAPCQDRSA